MYAQIMEQVRQLIIAGSWPPGSALPSIRELAVSINVSVITVKRAYQELEREGVIITRHGKGSFVSEHTENALASKRKELTLILQEACALAKLINLDEQALQDELHTIFQSTQ